MNGQNLGEEGGTGDVTLISKFNEKSWDIYIKNLTVYHSQETKCNVSSGRLHLRKDKFRIAFIPKTLIVMAYAVTLSFF